MARKAKGRIYWRNQGGELRAYGDFRDLGGDREALKPEGEERATTDPVIAEALVGRRLSELQEMKRDKVLLGVRRRVGLVAFSAEHLVKKGRSSKVGDSHLGMLELQLQVAAQYFCNSGRPLPRKSDGRVDWALVPDRDLNSIGVEHTQAYLEWLAEKANGRGGTLSASTQLRYLSALNNLYRRAQAEGIVRGVNPVQALIDKPTAPQAEVAWLDTWEGALLLEAARTYPYDRPDEASAGARLANAIAERFGTGAEQRFCDGMRAEGMVASSESLRLYLAGDRLPTRRYLAAAAQVLGVPEDRLCKPRGWLPGPRGRVPAFMYPLLATFLLTGGRGREVFGLLLADVSLRRGTVSIRPNQWRQLKTKAARRTVPLFPQLRAIIEPHLEARRAEGAIDDDLLFPSRDTGGMITNVSKALDAIGKRAGWEPGELGVKAMRHAYCSARLQTLDRDFPVSEFVVAREMGHGGFALVRRVYGHLGEIRHRSEAVEYRIEQQHEVIPPERLRLLLRAQ
jgi:integrase